MANDVEIDLSFMSEDTSDEESKSEESRDSEEETEEQENLEQEEDGEDNISIPAEKYEEALNKIREAEEKAEKRKSRAKKGKYKAKKVVEKKDDLRSEFEMYKQEQVFLKNNPDADSFIDDIKDIATEKSLTIEDAYALYIYKNKAWKTSSKDWVHGSYKKHKPKSEGSEHSNFFNEKLKKNLKI